VGVPINFGDQFLGVLVVTAFLPHQFTKEDTEVLGMLAVQASIAIRNAQLYDQMNREIFERRKAELEIALLAGIGRLISSTMNIDEIYEQFAAEAQKLISFDSISINLFNFQENTLRVAYVSGVDIDGRRPGDAIVLAGSLSEAVIRTRTGLRVQPASFDEIEDQFPLLSPMFQAEMQSFVSVPLIYRNEVIGVLHFASKKQNAYTEQAFHLAERIGIQIAGAIGNAHLFNDLNKAEKALRESEELFKLFMNHSPIYTFIKDVTPTRSLILQSSENYRQMIGIPGSEMVGMTMDDLFPPEFAAKITAEDWAVVSKGEVLNLEENFDGRSYTTIKFPIVQGEKTLLAGYTIDVTDRKQAEAERGKLESQNRQLHKAESLNRMAGAIAHTFNNQLGVVIGNLELAFMDLPKVAGPILHSLTAAMRASQKAAEVSGQMLTYLGQSFDKRELLDISETCRRNLPILKASMPGTVNLEINLPSPGPAVMINASEIQQVLTNLITNAWEAVGTGRGSIHLSVKTASPADIPESHRFPVGQQPQESAYACLEVADTGCGIAENDIEKLFDPFFTSKFTGRGLGLAMVLGIVKAHDGCVTVESTPGQGSTFRVFLPVSAKEVPRQPDFVAQPLATGGGTILLVDDEEMLRDMAAALLKRLGFSVLAAKDGVEAVEIFRQQQDEIRLVLSDLTMPRMNGWETLTALRELAPDLPVILTSGYDKAQVMAGDHPELPQVFLGKPYTLKGLGEAISQALVGKKQ
jgi:PAS domain S-box-containing protein